MSKILLNTIEILKSDIKKSIEISQKNFLTENIELPNVTFEIPADRIHGELSTNIAMTSAKIFKMPPKKVAETILSNFVCSKNILEKVEIAGPGFINFYLNQAFFCGVLTEVKSAGKNYGESNLGQGKKLMIEFVSANPTGPMHIGNARGGALGDCLAAVMEFAGYNVFKEFYVNDAGNQIEKFALSLDVRYQQICGNNSINLPENAYHGEDIKILAQEFFSANSHKFYNSDENTRRNALIEFALPKNIKRMKDDLRKYKIDYDEWFYESKLHENDEVDDVINTLIKKGLTYELDGALWYKATQFGAEKDEVLRRKNGIPTYFAADIAYHKNKFLTRGFDICINIWGADHHGHVNRLKGAMAALGIDKNNLHILLVQLVRLLKNGEVMKMSKRTGKAVQLADLLDEVGADSARFIFNMREANIGMDFDLDLAVKQDPQNPVYYVQYAYARICSIFNGVDKNILNEYDNNANLNVLNTKEEKELIFYMAKFSSEVENCAKKLDSTKLTHYVINLANLFHKFYNLHKVNCDDKNVTMSRLFLCSCIKIVIENIFSLFKISLYEKM